MIRQVRAQRGGGRGASKSHSDLQTLDPIPTHWLVVEVLEVALDNAISLALLVRSVLQLVVWSAWSFNSQRQGEEEFRKRNL